MEDINSLWADSSDDEDYIPRLEELVPLEAEVEPTESEETISKRTRAHLSLENIELEQLEERLQESPSSPFSWKINDDEEYKKFLLQLQTGELDEDEADVDWTEAFVESVLNLEDSEEYRNDRAVHVSKQEVTALIEEAMPFRPLKKQKRHADKPITFAFSEHQMQQLKKQLQDHFQLLIQVFLIAKNQGDSSSANNSWSLLSTFCQSSAISPSSTTKQPFYSLRGIELLDKLQPYASNQGLLSNQTVTSICELCKPYFDPKLSIIIQDTKGRALTRIRFTNAEDALLAMGLHLYGLNWKLIRRDFLPSKSERQLSNRYKNRSCKTAPDNPIKEYKRKMNEPLSQDELYLLCEGLSQVGPNQWEKISRLYLPHRTPKFLKKIFSKKEDANSTPNNDSHLESPTQQNSIQNLKGKEQGDSSPDLTVNHNDDCVAYLPEESIETYPSKARDEKKNLADNELVVDGVCIKWSKDEDRLILMAAKTKGATISTWSDLIRSNGVSKNVEQITQRYNQLIALFKRSM